MTTKLVADSGGVRSRREAQAIEETAALRQANVEKITGAARNGRLGVVHTRQRLVEHHGNAERLSQLGQAPDFSVRHRLLDTTDVELQERRDFRLKFVGTPRFVRIETHVHPSAKPAPDNSQAGYIVVADCADF